MALTIDSLRELYEKLGGEDFGNVTTIPEALDKLTEVATGGGDEYETAAEIAVGQMTEEGGMYIADNVAIDLSGVSADDALYFNSADYPLTRKENEGIVIYGYNFNESGISGTPAYGIVINPTDGNSIVSDSGKLENTTVKILKKVSGGGSISVDSELSETSEKPVQNKVITAALNERPVDFIITADFNPETKEITNASASLADVLDVAGAVRNIVFILHAAAESGGTTVNVYDRFADSNIENHGGGNGVVSFSKIEKDSGTPIMFSIIAASGDQNGKWVYDEVTLATATP